MNNQHPHGALAPGASRLKRKEREPYYPANRSPQKPPPQRLPRPTVTSSTTTKGAELKSSNQVLAGYMAYEFLTKGTVLGQKLDPGRAEKRTEAETETLKANESYKEITSLLMMKSEGGSGVHIPGIVNPTQLARWIQM